jgi:hypothetical protein
MTHRKEIGLSHTDSAPRAGRATAGRWLQRLFGGFLVMSMTVPFGACGDEEAELIPVEGGPGGRYARAAVFLASCRLPRGSYDAPLHVWQELGAIYSDLLYPRPSSVRVRTDAMLACFELATTGCAALFDCFGESFEAADRAAPCLATCDGQVLTRCETFEAEHIYYRRRTDCERSGMACSEDGCVPLTEPAPSPCEEGTKYPRCDGDAPLRCYLGVEERDLACGEQGLTCVLLSDSFSESAVCQGTQGACKDNGNYSGLNTIDGFRCRGTVTDTCFNGGARSVDCATLGEGFTCLASPGGEGCGLSADCMYSDGGTRCEGTKLLFCNAGVLQAVDCAELGFSGCDAKRGICTPGFFDLE